MSKATVALVCAGFLMMSVTPALAGRNWTGWDPLAYDQVSINGVSPNSLYDEAIFEGWHCRNDRNQRGPKVNIRSPEYRQLELELRKKVPFRTECYCGQNFDGKPFSCPGNAQGTGSARINWKGRVVELMWWEPLSTADAPRNVVVDSVREQVLVKYGDDFFESGFRQGSHFSFQWPLSADGKRDTFPRSNFNAKEPALAGRSFRVATGAGVALINPRSELVVGLHRDFHVGQDHSYEDEYRSWLQGELDKTAEQREADARAPVVPLN